jgi:redox-sensitive bicupin YhaK (pirin superfamily)
MDDPAKAQTGSQQTGSDPQIYTAPRTNVSHDQGKFRTHFDFPGRAVPDHDDHGYGPLATVVESFMDPGTLIPMHQHRDEEIISWVPAGVMRHDDGEGNELVTDADHLMVMNAGSGFWHAEETLADDPPLRMLQIFVRPHSLGLEPGIQHEPIPDPTPNEWRHLFGPEGGDAPLYVRNEVDFYDCRLDAGGTVSLPAQSGRDTYLYVFEGAVTVGEDEEPVGYTESALVTGDRDGEDVGEVETGVSVTATEDSVLVAFVVDPDAPVTRQGTIGR